LLLVACGLFDEKSQQQFSTVSLLSGKITIYDFSGGAAGEVLQEETFDAASEDSAGFAVELKKTDHPVLIELTGAKIQDWATLDTLAFDSGDKWMTLLPEVDEEGQFVVTPLTTIAACHSLYHIQQQLHVTTEQVKQAIGASQAAFSEHLSSVDYARLIPVPLESEVGNITGNVKQSLFLAGFSQIARDYATKAGLTPNKVVNVITLTEKLCDDLLEDGILDGEGALGAIQLGGVNITDRALRIDLAMGMVHFLGNQTVNKSGIAPQDIITLGNEIATNIDPTLFPQGVPVFSIDLVPPEVTVMQPQGSTPQLSGIVAIQIMGSDPGSDIAELSVSLMRLNPGLEFVDDLDDSNAAPELFETNLVTTILADGNYLLNIVAKDTLDNQTVKTFDFVVDN
jgi:hypothetical protein